MNDAPIIDHKDAYQLAAIKREDSNLARCYLDLLRRICETSQVVADGYRREGKHEEAANAASNTGYFILSGADFSHQEILDMIRDLPALARGSRRRAL